MTVIFNLIKSSVGISEKELMYVDMLVVFIKKSKKNRNLDDYSFPLMQQKNPNPNMIKIPKIVPPTSSYGMGGSDAETLLIKINIENRINKIITLFFLKIITNYTLLKIIYMIYYFCFKKVKKENNFIILQNLKFILSP